MTKCVASVGLVLSFTLHLCGAGAGRVLLIRCRAGLQLHTELVEAVEAASPSSSSAHVTRERGEGGRAAHRGVKRSQRSLQVRELLRMCKGLNQIKHIFNFVLSIKGKLTEGQL